MNWEALREAFRTELEDHVRALNQLLLRLERSQNAHDGRTEIFDSLFREAHSLKGAARSMEMHDVERVAHALESALGEARSAGAAPSGPWFDAVYRAVDTLLLLGSADDGSSATDVAGAIEAVGAQLSTPVNSSSTAPPEPSAPLPPRVADAPPSPSPAVAPVVSRQPEPALPVAPTPETRPLEAESVRVAVRKLDAMLAQAGELSVATIRVDQRMRDFRLIHDEVDAWQRERRRSRGARATLGRGPVDGEREADALRRAYERDGERLTRIAEMVREMLSRFRRDVTALGVASQTISDEVMRARLLPADTVLRPFERMVRDLSRATGKEVRLVVEGGETEVDRKILEQVRDPVMHMLRNAVDHGIEPPDARQAAGKPREGSIVLRVEQRGDGVAFQVADDGAGLDPTRLRESAVAKGLLSAADAQALDDRAALELVFLPGFSTSATVTDTSGRGVGMDVARDNMARIGGRIDIASVIGEGTTFTLSVPLSIVTTRAVLADVGGRLFAIPTAAVERLVRVSARDVRTFEGRRAIPIDGEAVAATSLRAVLGLPGGAPRQWANDVRTPALVIRQGDRRVVMMVQDVPSEQELVVKALHWPLRRVRHVSGAAVIESGETVIVLDAAALVRTALGLLQRRGPTAQPAAPVEERPAPRRLLVVDDSVTTRTLERSILESAGYQVTSASNGLEALRLLNDGSYDLVVSDVDMPEMDGFTLTGEMRRDGRLRQVPVILVTSLESQEYRERGLAAGADAYIVKSAFDQGQLLETIGRLL